MRILAILLLCGYFCIETWCNTRTYKKDNKQQTCKKNPRKAISAEWQKILSDQHLTMHKSDLSKDEQKNLMNQIEQYLNSIRNFKSDFLQVDKYGRSTVGDLFWKDHKYMKMDCKNPSTFTLVVRDNIITMFDKELKESSETPCAASPISIFIGRKIKFDGLKIIYTKASKTSYFVKLSQKEAENDGAIEIEFSKKPFALQKWSIFEKANNNIATTTVYLFNTDTKSEIDMDEFEKPGV